MNFFKIIFISLYLITISNLSLADNHSKEQDIIEKAKEINKKLKEKQSNTQANISSELNPEEPLPLNDPFVGDSSLSGGGILMSDPEEAKNEMSLYKFKLAGVMSTENDSGFVSLMDAAGEVITVGLFEELSPGVRLIGVNNREAVFEKNGESLLVINFKNQIKERSR